VYVPFGELFIEERNSWNTPYKFSGKELDDETGYNYFGARYYDPNISIWLSVDPLSDKHPDYTPYAYVYNNPVNLFDPFGLDTFNIHLSDNSINRISVEGSSAHTYNIYGEEGALMESYDLEENDYGFVSFPEDGPNWGRYGSRDKGGDNWASPATAAAFFGLLYSWSSDPLSSDVYFDDISGFMGQNIGHTTHRTGDDIDIRYFGAGSGTNINSASIDCSTCWNTISKRSQADYDLLFYSTYNFLRLATEWGFETNYVYPQGFPFTRDRAHNTHRHHIHIGR